MHNVWLMYHTIIVASFLFLQASAWEWEDYQQAPCPSSSALYKYYLQCRPPVPHSVSRTALSHEPELVAEISAPGSIPSDSSKTPPLFFSLQLPVPQGLSGTNSCMFSAAVYSTSVPTQVRAKECPTQSEH